MEFKIRPIQIPMFKHLLSYEKGALWAGMGTGKTSVILYYLKLMQKVDPGPVLIFAPLQVAENTWPEQRDQFELFHSLKITKILGTAKQRLEALQFKSDIYTINYENAVWLKNNLPKNLKFKYLIIDEATRVKSLRLRKGSKQAKAIFKISLDIKYLWELTGTSTINGLIDLWGQLGYIDKGERLGKTFTGYKEKYFTAISHGDFVKYKPFPFAIEEISEKIRDVCATFRSEDYYNIKKPIIYTLKVNLPDKVQKMYNTMEQEMFIELPKMKDITAWFKAASTMKCMQIANGHVYRSREEWIYLHSEKIKALKSIIAEAAGAPVLLSYCFKADLALILKNFPQAVHIDASNAKKIIPFWNKSEISLMVGHPASIGYGLNLQHGGNILVYYSHDWSPEEREQIYQRIGPVRQMQAGYNRNVFVYNIITAGTIDEVIIQSHLNKQSIQEVIDEYTRKK